MPRGNPDDRGASGRPALRALRDDDFEDLVAAVMYLPEMARNDGIDAAISFVQIELSSLVDMLFLAKLDDENRERGEALYLFFEDGAARLLCDDDRAGFNFRTDLCRAVERERFAPAVRAVFERSAPMTEERYAPALAP